MGLLTTYTLNPRSSSSSSSSPLPEGSSPPSGTFKRLPDKSRCLVFWIIPSNKIQPVSNSCWKEPSSSSSNQGRSSTQHVEVQNKLISHQCVNPAAIPVIGMSSPGDTACPGVRGVLWVSEGRLLLFCISRGAVLSAQLLLGQLRAFSTVLVTNRAGSSPGDRGGTGG